MNKIILLITFFSVFRAGAQIIDPIKWSFGSSVNGEEISLIFKATMDQGWHLYDTDLPEDGPISTMFVFEDSTLFAFTGELQKSPLPVEKFDKTFEMNLRYFSDSVVFTRTVRLLNSETNRIKGYVTFMGCDDESCLPPNEVPFDIFLAKGTVTSESARDLAAGETDTAGTAKGQTIWLFLVISFLAGLAAILTPCVFPMIPMTVSFFMRNSGNKAGSIRSAFVFGLSIVAIFTLLGALFSVGIFGPNVGNILSTHWIPNLLFFILFFVFALSFFGLFEIVLPGSLVNKTDAKADKGGWLGPFFMALTTVIVSFSCTGPFIGALIIEAVQGGGLRPLAGMFFFGLAFATPFTLLAIFPSTLNKLPKSGGWMNVVKITFAFILLAFGLKFLSNIDQVYGLNLISRDLYLILWIVLFALLALYFMGKIRFSHDSEWPHLGVGRLFLVILTLSFTLYLFTGLFGNPLKTISSLLPPAAVSGQVLSPANVSGYPSATAPCGPAKYADKLHLPRGLQGYFDFKQGLACAREQQKPALVIFKGHACANCKKMENTVWTDPEILRMVSEGFVVIGLYTDDRTTLPENEWVNTSGGKQLKTMGKVNLNLQVESYSTNTIPFHVIIKPDGTELHKAVTFDTEAFRDFITEGLQ